MASMGFRMVELGENLLPEGQVRKRHGMDLLSEGHGRKRHGKGVIPEESLKNTFRRSGGGVEGWQGKDHSRESPQTCPRLKVNKNRGGTATVTKVFGVKGEGDRESTGRHGFERKVSWADQVGRSLTSCCHDGSVKSSGSDRGGGGGVKRDAGVIDGKVYPRGGWDSSVARDGRRSFKEALLQPARRGGGYSFSKQSVRGLPSVRTAHSSGNRSRRANCFRCLGPDHWARECRDPVRCIRCRRTGHYARDCREPVRSKMQGNYRGRPQSAKVFVPLSEGFYLRQQQGRRAILAIPMGNANLGHYPQGLIANDLAVRFGGFSNDFLVTKYRERDFVIFLPQWVQMETLIRGEGVRLGHCRLRCFAWNPYREAVRARLTYKVWIKLFNLPFECWTECRVSAIVCGFGRYLRCDDASRNILDFNAFKCLVAVDDPADIPENIFLTLGDHILVIRVAVINTAPFGGDDRGTPFAGGDPNEGGDQTDPAGRQLARWVDRAEEAADATVVGAGADSDLSNSGESSEIRDRRRRVDRVAKGTVAPSRLPGGHASADTLRETSCVGDGTCLGACEQLGRDVCKPYVINSVEMAVELGGTEGIGLCRGSSLGKNLNRGKGVDGEGFEGDGGGLGGGFFHFWICPEAELGWWWS